MTLTSFIRDLGIVGLALYGLLAIALVVKRTWRQFPVFAGYVWLTFAMNIAGYVLLKDRVTYFYTYWIGEAVGIGLGLAVVYEIFRHLFSIHGALQRLATLTFRIAAVVLVLAGLVAFFVQSSSNFTSLGRAINSMEQAARIIEVGLMMILFICSTAFGLHWKQAEFGIALGLGFFASIELLAVTLRPLLGPSHSAPMDIARILAFDTSLVVWLSYLLVPEKDSSGAESPKQAQLEQWNQAIRELISQ
jgi:hypothetical protein